MYGERRFPDRHPRVHARPTKMGTNRRLLTATRTLEKDHARARATFFHPSEFRCALHRFRKGDRGLDRTSSIVKYFRLPHIEDLHGPLTHLCRIERYQSRHRHALHPLMPDERRGMECARAYQRKSNYPNRMEFNSSRSSVGTTLGEQRKKTVKETVGGAN